MDKIYLSIDLDYWMELDSFHIGMSNFLNKALNLGVPFKTVESHEQLLSHVNGSGANILYNVDHHSDIIDNNLSKDNEIEREIFSSSDKFFRVKKQPAKLVEGNWVNFVKFRKKGTFLWLYPLKECYRDITGDRGSGRCDDDRNPFSKSCMNITGWKSVRRRRKRLLTAKEWKQVVRVGISCSPDWLNYQMCKKALVFLKKRKAIPKKLYLKMHKTFIGLSDSQKRR